MPSFADKGKAREMSRRSLKVAFSLLMMTTSVCLMAENSHQWETATVVSQILGSNRAGVYVGPLGAGSIAAPINIRSNMVVVETEQYRYRWQEFTRSPNWHHFIVLTVNDEVKFYRDGQWFVVLDNQNKKHKFTLIGATKK